MSKKKGEVIMPTRCCIACKKRNDKSQLIRLVGNENHDCIYDKEQRINSRGIYLCRNVDCIERLKKILTKNKLNIKISINSENLINILEKIENELGE